MYHQTYLNVLIIYYNNNNNKNNSLFKEGYKVSYKTNLPWGPREIQWNITNNNKISNK